MNKVLILKNKLKNIIIFCLIYAFPRVVRNKAGFLYFALYFFILCLKSIYIQIFGRRVPLALLCIFLVSAFSDFKISLRRVRCLVKTGLRHFMPFYAILCSSDRSRVSDCLQMALLCGLFLVYVFLTE